MNRVDKFRVSGCVLAVSLLGCRAAQPTPHVNDVAPSIETDVIAVGEAQVELRLPDGPMRISNDAIAQWVADCARAIETYYGRLPVRHTIVEVQRTNSRGVDSGKTVPLNGAVLIRIGLGARADERDLARDWVMTHELVHTALPNLPETHLWLEEGLATYVEPIARAQAGLETAEDVWRQLVEGLPLGLPQDGDRGLDRTPTWGRTYWGGALFCLLADIGIRERTHNSAGLQDALRAIVASGRSALVELPIDRVLAQADAAVGAPILSDLYARHATHAESVDLAELWRELGVSMRSGQVLFDDSAPLADVRRAITQAEPDVRWTRGRDPLRDERQPIGDERQPLLAGKGSAITSSRP